VGRGIALLFHDRGTRRGWVVSSTPRPHFTPGKDPVTILQEAGWAPGPVWTGGKSHPHRDWIPDRPACSQSLYRLSYPAHDWHTVHNHNPGEKKNVYQPHSNDIHQLYNTVPGPLQIKINKNDGFLHLFKTAIYLLGVTLDLRRGVNEIFAILGFYGAQIGGLSPTSWHSLSVPSSRVQQSKSVDPWRWDQQVVPKRL